MNSYSFSDKSGRGVPKIVENYGESAFSFRKNSIVVTIPFTRTKFVGDKVGDKDRSHDLNQRGHSTKKNVSKPSGARGSDKSLFINH